MNEWISVKEELPPKNKVVYLRVGYADPDKEREEKVYFIKWDWHYQSGLFAYKVTRDDQWKHIDAIERWYGIKKGR